MIIATELEKQLQTVRNVYEHLQRMDDATVAALTSSFLSILESAESSEAPNIIPFIVVPSFDDIDYEAVMATVHANGHTGVVNTTPVQPSEFTDIEDVPKTELYLLLNVDTGQKFLNMSPENCLQIIREENRVPLTIREGLALVVHHPEILTDKVRYNCIQMPGSRIGGDQRIPSIWLSYKRPRLGWCWDRNIHTWLGSASADRRVG